MVIDSIFLRTPTTQDYHSRYVNSRSKYNVSYVVAFEVQSVLIRNQNNAVGFEAELRVWWFEYYSVYFIGFGVGFFYNIFNY